MFFWIAVFCGLAGVILAAFAIFTHNKKKRIYEIIGAMINFTIALSGLMIINIPSPEIYTTNGNSATDNTVYINTIPGLKVNILLFRMMIHKKMELSILKIFQYSHQWQYLQKLLC